MNKGNIVLERCINCGIIKKPSFQLRRVVGLTTGNVNKSRAALSLSTDYYSYNKYIIIMKTEFYHGYMYQIEYKKELSNSDYTQVYHIVSTDYKFKHAHEAIEYIMNDGSWRRKEWEEKNKQEPSMANALHSYHTFSYDEDLDVYVYTLVIPYDD